MCLKLGEIDADTAHLSQTDLDKLKSLLPELQQSGKSSQLEIILEAIQYIKNLQGKLHR